MDNFKLEFSNFVFLAVFPIVIGLWRRFKIETESAPLAAWNTNPRSLLRKRVVNKFIGLVNHYRRRGLKFLERGHATDVIQVGMRHRNGLQFQSMFVDGANNLMGVISGIDTDGEPGLFA